MAEVKRTRLEMSRDVGRAYRWALFKADRETCARLDKEAREVGEGWIAPEHIPADAAEEALEAVMTPPRISELTHIPVGTIYSWISRGLLAAAPADGTGIVKYRVRDVIAVEGRRRVRRLDSA